MFYISFRRDGSVLDAPWGQGIYCYFYEYPLLVSDHITVIPAYDPSPTITLTLMALAAVSLVLVCLVLVVRRLRHR